MSEDLNQTDEERALAQRLNAAAVSVSARPDLAEVEVGAGRIRGRRRLATGVVAAMLIAGAGGIGFGIGRSVSDPVELIASNAASMDARSRGERDELTDASTPPAAVPATTSPVTTAPGSPPPTVSPAPGTAELEASAVDMAVDMDGAWTPVPMELLYERVLGNGIRLRLQVGQTWTDHWSVAGWTPAGYCTPNREARITFDGAGLVDIAGAALYSDLYKGLQVQPGDVGWADDHPIRYLVVQADPAVTEVAVTWDDGLSDRVAVVDGIAVLVVEPATSDPYGVWRREFTFEVVDAGGMRLLARDDLDYSDDPDHRAGCNPPPPELPAPGEQPDDPAEAEQALRERFALLWDLNVERDGKRSVLDDWSGVEAAVEAVLAGGFAETAAAAEHRIEEVVFTSPTDAWFRYALLTDIASFYERYGTATLIDGDWQFPRAVMCQDLSLGGGTCEPGFEPILPPSWFERFPEDAR